MPECVGGGSERDRVAGKEQGVLGSAQSKKRLVLSDAGEVKLDCQLSEVRIERSRAEGLGLMQWHGLGTMVVGAIGNCSKGI